MSQYCRYKCEFMCPMCEQAERITIVAPPAPIQAQHSHARLPWNGWEGGSDEYEYSVVKYTPTGAPATPYVPVFIQLKVGKIVVPYVDADPEPLHLKEGTIVCGI